MVYVLEIEDLRLFLIAVRMGSISAAARHVSLSQPAVSRRIRNLEHELGTQLLDRSRVAATPTSQGLEFMHFADQVMQQYEALRLKLTSVTAFEQKLSIAASTTPGEFWLPIVLPQFQSDNPEIQLSLSVLDSTAVEASVTEQRCDLGFIGRPPHHQHLHRWVVAEDEIVLAVPTSHVFAGRDRVQVSELNGQSFVYRRAGSATRDIIDATLTEIGFHLSQQRTVLEVTSVQAQLNAIAAGHGIGFVSQMALASLQQERVVRVFLAGAKLKRNLYMIQNPQVVSSAVTKFISYICNKFITKPSRLIDGTRI